MSRLAIFLALWLATAVAAADSPREPPVRDVLAMALRAARSLGPERTRELCRRARLAGLVPTLRLSAQRGVQQDSSSTSRAQSDDQRASQGDDLTLEATLTFDLPRLVFATEEVRILSVERWLAADRRRLLEEVTRLYFQRRRLLTERAASAAPDVELDTALAEAEALLDAFTDGAFARALAELRAPP